MTYQTMGDIAESFRAMQADGMTRASIEYALEQVYPTPIDSPNARYFTREKTPTDLRGNLSENFDRTLAIMLDGSTLAIHVFADRVEIQGHVPGGGGAPLSIRPSSCAIVVRTDVPEPTLLWPQEATILAERLDQMELGDAETGERFTVDRCDNAIQSAVETFNAVEGARVVHLNSKIWLAIRDDVALSLDIDPLTLEGVAL